MIQVVSKEFFQSQNRDNFVKVNPIDQERLQEYLIYYKVRSIKIKLENLLERMSTYLQEADGRLGVFQRFVEYFNTASLKSVLSRLQATQLKIRHIVNELRDDYLVKLLLVNNTIQEIDGRIAPNRDMFNDSNPNWNNTSNNTYTRHEFRSNFGNQEITAIVTSASNSQRRACLDLRSFLVVNQSEDWNDIKRMVRQVITNSTREELKLFIQFLVTTLDQIVRRSKGTIFEMLQANNNHLQLPQEQQMHSVNNKVTPCRICCMCLSSERFSGMQSPWNCQCNGLSDVCTICKNRMNKCPYCRSEKKQFCV